MARGKQKKPGLTKRHSGTTVMVLFFMLLFFAAVGVNAGLQYRRYLALKSEETRIMQEIEETKLKTAQIETERNYYQSDAYIEKVAREQLGLVKPNEVLFINRSN